MTILSTTVGKNPLEEMDLTFLCNIAAVAERSYPMSKLRSSSCALLEQP